MDVAIPYTYFLRNPEEGTTSVVFHGPDIVDGNSTGLRLAPRGIESVLRESAGREPAAMPSISGVVVANAGSRQLCIPGFGALPDRRLVQG